jgi:urocanate hydratase
MASPIQAGDALTQPSAANPDTDSIEHELECVFLLYAALAKEMDAEAGLGGKLLYAGQLDAEGCRMVCAANIAGAATLAATADAAQARQAMRDGVVDFVVTTLDEALRILKNQIRKRETVAVCVTLSPQAIVAQMQERGVLPDLLAPLRKGESESDSFAFISKGAQWVAVSAMPPGKSLTVLKIPTTWSQRTAEFDAILLEFIAHDDHLNRRWLRLAPRYLGTQARRLRSLACDEETASRIMDRIAKAV